MCQQLLQLDLVFAGQRHLQHGIIGAEDFRQHCLRITPGQRPQIRLGVLRQFLDLVQTHRHAHVRLDQQIIFRQKPCEQHPMPMLISALLREMLNFGVAPFVSLVSQLFGVSTKFFAQLALLS